jgi:hypothetical protein
MKCEGCEKEFNATKRRPHFLIQCGHSLCQKCIKKKFVDSSVICPRCDTANFAQNVGEFPVNMAIVEAERTSGLMSKQSSNILKTSDLEGITIESICPRHGKKFEGRQMSLAFCEEDKSLICINCILEGGYQSKKIISIEDVDHGD